MPSGPKGGLVQVPGRISLGVVAWAAIAASQAGCGNSGDAQKHAKPTATAVASNPSIPDPLATIGDGKITLADVRARVGDQLDQLDIEYRRARDKLIGGAVDTIVRSRLFESESKRTGKTEDQLVAAEITGSIEPSDAEINTWFNDNQARLGGRSLDQVRSQIAAFLRNRRRADAATKLEDRLRAEHRVTVAFEPYRVQFTNDGAPTLGRKDAPVTLVEFSDFQCPFCKQAAPTLKQVAQKFGDKVQIVYRQYPIESLHPFALKAAEASLCGNDQGKFWELHDAMFADQTRLAVSDLKQTARRLGLDGNAFDSCLDSGRHVAQVQKDIQEGQRVGITGTPMMFINGVVVDGGAVGFSMLEGLIRHELSRKAPTS
jgi:protein-disulfide isomerase